jgi:hypothetical protein
MNLQDRLEKIRMESFNRKQDAKEAAKKAAKEVKTFAEKAAELTQGYVPEQITPAVKKVDNSFWATYDENDESGQL